MNEQLIAYIKEQLAAGATISQILTVLTQKGFSQEQIDSCLKIAMQSSPSVAPVSSLPTETVTSSPEVAASPEKPPAAKRFDLTKAFVIIGAILIIIATIIAFYSQWSDVEPIGRILFMFVPMVVLFALAAFLNKLEHYREVGNVALGLGSFMLPLSIGTFILQTSIIEEINPMVIFISAVLSLPVYIILEYFSKKQFMGAYTVLALYTAFLAIFVQYNLDAATILWSTFLISLAILGVGFVLTKYYKSDALVYLSLGTIFSLGFLLISSLYSLDQAAVLDFSAYAIIISIFFLFYLLLAAGYYFLYKKLGEHSFYSLKRVVEEIAPLGILLPYLGLGADKAGYSVLALAISILMVLASTVINIKTLLLLGSFGIIVSILTLTGKIFNDSSAWPILLFIAGFVAIGIGLVIRHIYRNRKEQGPPPVLYGLGADSNEEQKTGHSSRRTIIIIILVVLLGLPLLYTLLALLQDFSGGIDSSTKKIPKAETENYTTTPIQTIPEATPTPATSTSSTTASESSLTREFDGYLLDVIYNPLNKNDRRTNKNLNDVNEILASTKSNGDYAQGFLIVDETQFEANGAALSEDGALSEMETKYKKIRMEYEQFNYPDVGYEFIAKKVVFY